MPSPVKYPRTYHLPWSLGATDDDKMIPNVNHFLGKEIIVTEKMDGENSNLYRSCFHARSIDENSHPSQGWIKQFHSQICGEIPEGWRICGENLYAKHSIEYRQLVSFFYGFSIWNEENVCLSWAETLLWFQLIGITPVPVLYSGIWDENKVRECWTPNESNNKEGYVVRLAQSFHFSDFSKSLAKFVRPNHVQSEEHWKDNWTKNSAL